MKKILIISPFLPSRDVDGGSKRLFFLLKELSIYFDIDLIYLRTEQTPHLDQRIKVFCKKVTSIEIEHNITSVWSTPFWFYKWYSKKLREEVDMQLKKTKYYLIQVESTQLLYLSDLLPKHVFKIFSAYDVSTISFFRRQFDKPLPVRVLNYFRVFRVYLFELFNLSKFNLILSVSIDDAQYIKKLFGINCTLVLENGIEEIKKRVKNTSNKTIVGFLGSYEHHPNTQAVSFIINKILPEIDGTDSILFCIAGGKLPFKPSSPLINYIGYIKNLDDFFSQIDVFIAPIFSGSGSRIKILDALAHKIPVISTNIGAEGLPSCVTKYIRIANSGKEFAIALKTLNKEHVSIFSDADLKNIIWSNIVSKYVFQLKKIINEYE